MTNQEFFDLVKLLTASEIGMYKSPTEQAYAYTFGTKPREVTSTVGLEIIVGEKYSVRRNLPQGERFCDCHTVLLLQHPFGVGTFLHKALEKLQTNFNRKYGAVEDLVVVKDGDFSTYQREMVVYTVYFIDCVCGYTACDAELYVDPLELY